MNIERKNTVHQVGDRVRVRSDLTVGGAYDGVFCSKEIVQLKGQNVTITAIEGKYCFIQECDCLCGLGMFEPLSRLNDISADEFLSFLEHEE